MTSDMMFYNKATAEDEKKIRYIGLEKLRKKIHEKIQKYNSIENERGTAMFRYPR